MFFTARTEDFSFYCKALLVPEQPGELPALGAGAREAEVLESGDTRIVAIRVLCLVVASLPSAFSVSPCVSQ